MSGILRPSLCGATALLLLLLAGCSYETGRVPEEDRSNQRRYHWRHTEIVDGQTSVASLAVHFGPPDKTSSDGRMAVYKWEVTRWEKDLPDRGNLVAPEGEPHNLVRHFFLLGLDPSGVVQWHRHAYYGVAGGTLRSSFERRGMSFPQRTNLHVAPARGATERPLQRNGGASGSGSATVAAAA